MLVQSIGHSRHRMSLPFTQCLVSAQSLGQKRDESLFKGGATDVDLLVREGGSCRRNLYFDSQLLQALDQV